MNISKITFTKLFANSSFLNERIGVEIDLNIGDDANEALGTAKALAEEFHKESYPELYKFNDNPLTTEETEIVREINACETMEALAKIKNRKEPKLPSKLYKYYTTQLKTLTDNYSNK